MAQSYDFLRARWPKLAALASDAMRLVEISPTVSLSSMRTFCEWASGIIIEMKGISVAEDADSFDKESAVLSSGAVPQNVKDAFRAIDEAPSKMRGPLGNAEVSRASLEQLDVIANWLVTAAGGTAPVSAASYQPAAPVAAPRRSVFGAQAENSGSGSTPSNNPVSVSKPAPAPEEKPFYETDESEESDNGGVSPYVDGRAPASSGTRIKNPLVLLIPIIIVCILIVILAVSIISKKAGSSSTPTAAPTAPSLPTLPPTPTPTAAPTPTPAPVVTTYLQDLTWSDSGFPASNVHLGKWNQEGQGQFRIEDVTYDHGIGMFISSNDITETRATRSVTYDLNAMYSTLLFDVGADKNWCYGSQSEFGSYRVVIRIDGVAVWDSGGLAATDGAKMNNSVPITGGQKMIIELTQRKGTRGTLNIVLGNIRLESNGVGAYSVTVPPTAETPNPEAVPTGADTPAP